MAQPYVPQPAVAPKKKGIPKWLIIVGIVIIVLAVAAASTGGKKNAPTVIANATPTAAAVLAPDAPTATTQPVEATAAPSIPKIGDTVVVGSWEVTVEKIEASTGFDWSGFKNMQTPKGKYIMVYATAKNITNKTASINSFDYKLIDETGAEFKTCAEFACFSYPKTVDRDSFNTETPPRTTTKLLAIFDVATDSKVFILQIEGDTHIILGGL